MFLHAECQAGLPSRKTLTVNSINGEKKGSPARKGSKKKCKSQSLTVTHHHIDFNYGLERLTCQTLWNPPVFADSFGTYVSHLQPEQGFPRIKKKTLTIIIAGWDVVSAEHLLNYC